MEIRVVFVWVARQQYRMMEDSFVYIMSGQEGQAE